MSHRTWGIEHLLEPAKALTGDGRSKLAIAEDPDSIAGYLDAGQPVLALQAPDLTWDTYHQYTATWSLLLVSSHLSTALAWDQLDMILDMIATALDVDEAKPAVFQPQTGAAHPAYILTITTPFIKE